MISIKNLQRHFKIGTEEIMALNGVNLEINEGEFVSIMGPSGSGKTTLLNIIGTLDGPTSGEVFFAGENILKLNASQQAQFRSQKMGFIFQFFYLQNYLTVLENIALPLFFQKINKAERIKKAKEIAAVVGLQERLNHKPEELSGGERQRVAIARALIHNPAVLLADEPTGNLDRKNSENIMQLLKNINQQKKTTIILVTHDEQAAQYAGRTIKMNKGEII